MQRHHHRALHRRYGRAGLMGRDPFFEVMVDNDGYWLWQGGAYRPLILTRKRQTAAVVRHAVAVLTGEKKFQLSIKTAKQLGRLG